MMSWNKSLTKNLLMLCFLSFLAGSDPLLASDNFVRDLIESLSDQSESTHVLSDNTVRDRRVASVVPADNGLEIQSPAASQKLKDSRKNIPMADVPKTSLDKVAFSNVLFPGASSLDVLSSSLVKLVSLSPSLDQSANSLSVLDSHESLSTFGKLASEPINLYTSFLIEVNRSSYTVQLSGFKENGEKNLLYSCRAGLGSPEYPTPKGTFYILRIFDNKPLWIPPQDREWAFGQVPSRSVYGGHMMPFFSKYSALSNRRNEIVLDDEDVIAAPIKMVDAGAYRIHGTDSPMSIGSDQSHGCVRLLNKTVAQLADTLKMYVGTTTRGETPNGVYINLARPVKLVLY